MDNGIAMERWLEARYKSVAAMTFLDEDSQPRQFTLRTIQTWYLRF